MRKLRMYTAVLSFLLAVFTARAVNANDLERAKDLYQRTEYWQVVRLLGTGPDLNAEAYELIGRAYYHLDDYKKATEYIERATELDPKNSGYYDWLGKVYGKRAETSSFVTAWSYAGKCRRNFERAVELDPKNIEAIDDLFEFLLNAPSIVGGGTDKAAAVAERARDLDPAKYHSLEARLAEKQKDFPREEKHLLTSLVIAPLHLGRILDMAEYLARRGRYEESEAMFERAEKIAPQNAELKFERAKTYVETGRKLDEARKLLLEYLNSSLTPDDPPRSDAERLLQQASRS
jgi:tetratricopeptide (TPR) repeat protein